MPGRRFESYYPEYVFYGETVLTAEGHLAVTQAHRNTGGSNPSLPTKLYRGRLSVRTSGFQPDKRGSTPRRDANFVKEKDK